ncbi:MAG: nitroreductase family protein [candidate division Zixibacteria bacterium]|nr:nitroreductase family protein [candidate division Zixibacteria bacterium]
MEKIAATDRPIESLLARRWSPRVFDPDRTVSTEELLTCLEAARWSPSCFNEQPWRFLIFDAMVPETLDKARDCLTEGNAWAKQAPVLILPVARKTFTRNNNPNRFAEYDVGAAILSFVLQATALGLFAHQMAGYNTAKARAYFGIPDGFEPQAMVALGYFGSLDALPEAQRSREIAPRTRIPVSEFAFRGGWGQTLT